MTDRTHEDDITVIEEQGGWLRDIVEIDLQHPVPSTPGWNLADLLRHVGKVYRWAALNVTALADERQRLGDSVEMPDDADTPAWFADGHADLIEVLGEADPDSELWTYGSDSTVRFWSRRMAQESLIHRWDAQDAIGAPDPLPPALAVDGIDEFLDLQVMTPGKLGEASSVLHVRADDANDDWSLDPSYDDELGRGFAEGDAHLHGPASDLLLSLWKRRDPDSVRWEGDRDAVTEWSTLLAELEL